MKITCFVFEEICDKETIAIDQIFHRFERKSQLSVDKFLRSINQQVVHHFDVLCTEKMIFFAPWTRNFLHGNFIFRFFSLRENIQIEKYNCCVRAAFSQRKFISQRHLKVKITAESSFLCHEKSNRHLKNRFHLLKTFSFCFSVKLSEISART